MISDFSLGASLSPFVIVVAVPTIFPTASYARAATCGGAGTLAEIAAELVISQEEATALLKEEHDLILRGLTVLEKAAARLAAGQAVPVGVLQALVAFFRDFADRCHHGKEEAMLFPALESAGLPREGGPTGVMCFEHEQGRACVRAMAGAAASHGDVERSCRAWRRCGVELLERIGPAVVMVHSAGGPFGWLVADARPELVRALVRTHALLERVVVDDQIGRSHADIRTVHVGLRMEHLQQPEDSLCLVLDRLTHGPSPRVVGWSRHHRQHDRAPRDSGSDGEEHATSDPAREAFGHAPQHAEQRGDPVEEPPHAGDHG